VLDSHRVIHLNTKWYLKVEDNTLTRRQCKKWIYSCRLG